MQAEALVLNLLSLVTMLCGLSFLGLDAGEQQCWFLVCDKQARLLSLVESPSAACAHAPRFMLTCYLVTLKLAK